MGCLKDAEEEEDYEVEKERERLNCRTVGRWRMSGSCAEDRLPWTLFEKRLASLSPNTSLRVLVYITRCARE